MSIKTCGTLEPKIKPQLFIPEKQYFKYVSYGPSKSPNII